MLQTLLRNWLLGTAQRTARQAAMQAAAQAAADARPADELEPPRPQKSTCHVGVVCALAIEAGGLVDRLAGVIRTQGNGFSAREGGLHGKRLVIIESGPGRAAARRAAQALVLGHQPKWILSIGFAGGLDDRLALGDILLADRILDASGRRFEIDLKLPESPDGPRGCHTGGLLTFDRIVREPDEKRALGQRHGAMAVDMESIAVAELCRDEKIRFLSVRVISDTASHKLPAEVDYLLTRRSRAAQFGAAAGAVVRRPGTMKDLWKLKEDAIVASERLGAFLAGVVQQLD